MLSVQCENYCAVTSLVPLFLNCWGRNFICHYFNISCNNICIKAQSVNVKFLLVLLFQLAELRQECEARGLETKGNKGELIARLQAYLEEHGKSQPLCKMTRIWPTSCGWNHWSLSVWLSPRLLLGKLLHPAEEDVDVDDVLAEDAEVTPLVKFQELLSFFYPPPLVYLIM